MPAAPAVGSAKTRHGQFKHPGELFRQFAFALSWPGHSNRSEHLGFSREVIDVPLQRFPALAVAFEPGREISLGASHIEIDTLPEVKPSELAHGNVPGPGQIEHRYVHSAIQWCDESLKIGRYSS